MGMGYNLSSVSYLSLATEISGEEDAEKPSQPCGL